LFEVEVAVLKSTDSLLVFAFVLAYFLVPPTFSLWPFVWPYFPFLLIIRGSYAGNPSF